MLHLTHSKQTAPNPLFLPAAPLLFLLPNTLRAAHHTSPHSTSSPLHLHPIQRRTHHQQPLAAPATLPSPRPHAVPLTQPFPSPSASPSPSSSTSITTDQPPSCTGRTHPSTKPTPATPNQPTTAPSLLPSLLVRFFSLSNTAAPSQPLPSSLPLFCCIPNFPDHFVQPHPRPAAATNLSQPPVTLSIVQRSIQRPPQSPSGPPPPASHRSPPHRLPPFSLPTLPDQPSPSQQPCPLSFVHHSRCMQREFCGILRYLVPILNVQKFN